MSKLFKPEENIQDIETFEIDGMVFKAMSLLDIRCSQIVDQHTHND